MATMERPKQKEEIHSIAPKRKSAEEAVQELEQRLAALGGHTSSASAASEEPQGIPKVAEPDPPPPPPYSAAAQSKPDVKGGKGGKNALLARIMAAQNKAKETAPPPSIESLGPPPPITQVPPHPQMAPPPSYDSRLRLGTPRAQHQAPPPSFDAIEDDLMVDQPSPPSYMQAPPTYMTAPPAHMQAPPAASAPTFEDLLGGLECFPPPPPPQQFMPAPPPPEEEIIMGMEGLSDEERRSLMEEQRQIMEQIEREKNANASAIAAAQADNFNMRSTSNAVNALRGHGSSDRTETKSKVNLGGGQEVALHGPERTKEAIKDGTAILVQCVNCENWMQVTGNATLMYCPMCAVISPIDQNTVSMSKAEAMQMEADRKLAESLQSEEYEQGERPRSQARPKPKAQQRQGDSWWDTVTNIFSGETKTEEHAAASDHPSASHDGSAGRVAESQPLFSCVVDSVNSTVGSFTGSQLSRDTDGKVHGVDSTSLLAVSKVGRDTE